MGRLCKISVPSMSQTLSFLIQPLKISIAPGRWTVMFVMSRLGVPERVDLDLGAASSHGVYAPYVRERSVSEHRCTVERGIAV